MVAEVVGKLQIKSVTERVRRGHKLHGTWAEKRITERRLYIYLEYIHGPR